MKVSLAFYVNWLDWAFRNTVRVVETGDGLLQNEWIKDVERCLALFDVRIGLFGDPLKEARKVMRNVREKWGG